jgi:hypothetical protein
MAKNITKIRQLVSRNAARYSAGGRQKRQERPIPSMPRLKCLEESADDAKPLNNGRLRN